MEGQPGLLQRITFGEVDDQHQGRPCVFAFPELGGKCAAYEYCWRKILEELMPIGFRKPMAPDETVIAEFDRILSFWSDDSMRPVVSFALTGLRRPALLGYDLDIDASPEAWYPEEDIAVAEVDFHDHLVNMVSAFCEQPEVVVAKLFHYTSIVWNSWELHGFALIDPQSAGSTIRRIVLAPALGIWSL